MRRHPLSVVFLVGAVAVLVRVILGVLFWDPVYSALTWDDFTRVLIAQHWALDPFVSPDLVWLPSQTWVLGSLFMISGEVFSTNPMALAAILNTTLVAATAVLTGLAAFRLAQSKSGGLLVFLVVLHSPWGFYTSLAGLAEPIYYLAIAVTMWAVVELMVAARPGFLWVGAAGVMLAAATRYEGWWLAVVWASFLFFKEFWPRLSVASTGRLRTLTAAGLPFLVPAAWMAYNWVVAGSPLRFAQLSAEYFSGGLGGPPTVLGRLLYYPISLVRADALLLAALLAVGWRFHRLRVVQVVFGVVVVHVGLFYVSSMLTGAIGAFNERFMFAFLLAATPVLGLIPEWIGGLRRPFPAVTAVVLLVVALGVTAYRWLDRPVEWTHAPDLLALMTAVDVVADETGPLSIAISPEMQAVEAIPLSTMSGEAVSVTVSDSTSGDHDLHIVRLPSGTWRADAVHSGRYQVTGPRSRDLPLSPMECPCDAWAYQNSSGQTVTVPVGPFAWTEFAISDPVPGAEAVASVMIEEDVGLVEIEVRSLYGHGFNPGRLTVEVRLGGEVVERWDIAEPSVWREVTLDIPDPGGVVEVAVVALPGIEVGWEWGKVSTVLVREIEDIPG